jgi:hypothetical protein
MGMSISGDSGHEIYFDTSNWVDLLRAARANGWTPAGTEPPCVPEMGDVSDWNSRDYTSNSFQRVTEADAKALALALEAATYVVDDADPLGEDAPQQVVGHTLTTCRYVDDTRVAALVELCKAGGFLIL